MVISADLAQIAAQQSQVAPLVMSGIYFRTTVWGCQTSVNALRYPPEVILTVPTNASPDTYLGGYAYKPAGIEQSVISNVYAQGLGNDLAMAVLTRSVQPVMMFRTLMQGLSYIRHQAGG
ncbi:hypothetical protein R1flu_028282 [Riccia fluitans]|uniref:Uncharacterized protein n=1 Tax=Riccia fluitans TaxID=41844 RepID=A0ABD1XL90_9MARC